MNLITYRAIIQVDSEVQPGFEEFSLDGIQKGKTYRTKALTLIVSPDNSSSLCFVLLDDDMHLVRKATSLFKVLKELP